MASLSPPSSSTPDIPDDVITPWGILGYITYKRTYARPLADGSSEEFRDTILRIVKACNSQLHINFTNDELKNLYKYAMSLKFSVAGRFLWQLGTSTVDRLGLASLKNCAFVKIDDPIRPFTWIFDMLMLGCGVGYSIQRQHVNKLPSLIAGEIDVIRCDTKDATFIVPDSREGWVALLEYILEAFFYSSKHKSFTYSTILIRGAGAKINNFGGIASGPEFLCQGVNNLVKILKTKAGQRLGSVDCLDIVNIISSIVVSGNVRRSALIAIGDADDIDFLRAKRWDLGNIPNWRSMSNNSVVCSNIDDLPEEFWQGYMGNGEPYGLINLELSRKIGRVMDGEKYPDPDVEGYNPCAEISLNNYGTCCLSEIFLPNVSSYEEIKDIATIAYRICKHANILPCHHPETEAIVHKVQRIGIGITGYMQSIEEQKNWLAPLYEYLREYDVEYSDRLGLPRSIKLTTVKPSGTLSLMAGVTPGAHPGIFQYFIRRMRIASNSDLIKVCRMNGYYCEYQKNFDGTDDHNTIVVEFPSCYPKGTVLAEQMTAIDQLEVIKKLQTCWSDNSVSVTIYYRKEELDDIKSWLRLNYTDNIKTCSFLLHMDHNFVQAPYEFITEEEYHRRLALVKPIVSGSIHSVSLEEDYTTECVMGACPVK